MAQGKSDELWQAEARSEAVYTGRHLEIIQRRKKVKSKTLEARRDYYRIAREQRHGL